MVRAPSLHKDRVRMRTFDRKGRIHDLFSDENKPVIPGQVGIVGFEKPIL